MPEVEESGSVFDGGFVGRAERMRGKGILEGRRKVARKLLRKYVRKKFGSKGQGELYELIDFQESVDQLEDAILYLPECDRPDQLVCFIRRICISGEDGTGDEKAGHVSDSDHKADEFKLPLHTQLTFTVIRGGLTEIRGLERPLELEEIGEAFGNFQACLLGVELEGKSEGKREEIRHVMRRLASKKFGRNRHGELHGLAAGVRDLDQLEIAFDFLWDCDDPDQFSRFLRRAAPN